MRGIPRRPSFYARADINGNGEWEDNDAACRVVFVGLQKRITCRSIFEIGHCALGRGGAVGAGRELPAHPRMPALTNAASFIGGRGLNVLIANADCRGAVHLRNAKIPPATIDDTIHPIAWGR